MPAFRLVRFPGPLPEPDVQVPPHPALHESRQVAVAVAVFQRPMALGSSCPVAVSGDRDLPGVEESDAIVCEVPSVAEVASSQELPVGSAVFATEPYDHSLPRVVVEVAEGPLRGAVPEVGGPASEHRVGLAARTPIPGHHTWPLPDGGQNCHRGLSFCADMNTKATADTWIGQLAEQQAGCVARAQALERGFSDDMIRYRLRTQRWRRVHPGVYVLGGVPSTWMQEVWAAALAVGPGVSVTHETALLLHGVRDTQLPQRPVTLTVSPGQHHRVQGAVVHQIKDLSPDHFTEIAGLRVSVPARAVVDIAAKMGSRPLGGVLDELVVARRTTLVDVSTCLARLARPGKPGVSRLAQVLDSRGPGFVPPHSELERRLFEALAAAGLPEPVRQLQLPGRGAIEGFADAGYPDAKMLVEADGRRWHTRARDMRRDNERDAEANRAGWITLRFLYDQIVAAPTDVAETVAGVRRTRLEQLGSNAA